MKVFVWKRIEHATDNYHPEGGVVVFADTEERARELANSKPGLRIDEREEPDDEREVAGGVEAVYVMRDAGCC